MSDYDCEDDDVEYDYSSQEEDDSDADMMGELPKQKQFQSNRETSISSWDNPNAAPYYGMFFVLFARCSSPL
jgi:hypothetical protein